MSTHSAKADAAAAVDDVVEPAQAAGELDGLEEQADEFGDEDDGEEEDGEGEENGEEDDESFTGASDLEEEARYEDQPACGLSPRLVVRRGCEALQALDPPPADEQSAAVAAAVASGAPTILRVDTLAGFERAVGRVGADTLGLTSPNPVNAAPALSRVQTLSALPEVREAFDAVPEDGASASAEPLAVRRVDTMELLQDMAPAPTEEEAEPSAKRQRATA